jgi:hypothetical protein
MIEGLLEATVLFAFVLGLALVIERVLEWLRAIYDMLDSRYDWYKFWNRRTHRLRVFIEQRLRLFELVSPQAAKGFLHRFNEMLLSNGVDYPGNMPVLCGDLVRQLHIKVVVKLLAIIAGVLLATTYHVNLVDLWLEAAKPDPDVGSPLWHGLDLKWWTWLSEREKLFGEVITGVTIGLGSGPVHKLISRIEQKRDERQKPVEAPNA